MFFGKNLVSGMVLAILEASRVTEICLVVTFFGKLLGMWHFGPESKYIADLFWRERPEIFCFFQK